MNWIELLAKINKKADKEEILKHEHSDYAKKEHSHTINQVEGMDVLNNGEIDTIINNALK